MSGKALFACSKCFSRHPFEELSTGQQLCKNCRISTTLVKCIYCRLEFYPAPTSKLPSACKKCEYNLNKYGRPKACECCRTVAAFGQPKCMRCASYEVKYGPPIPCDECKQRCAFDKRDENKKYNGKLLCWLCVCAFKRAVLKAKVKRAHEPSSSGGRTVSMSALNSDLSTMPPVKKSSRCNTDTVSKPSSRSGVNSNGANNNSTAASGTKSGLDFQTKSGRSKSTSSVINTESGNGLMGLSSMKAPAVVTIDPNSSDHVVAMTNLKERIASLEKRLQQKDKELLEKDKLLTELKGKNFEKENEMRNKIKEIDRLNDMKVENLNRKVSTLLKEIAGLKKGNKKPLKDKRDYSPKYLLMADDQLSRDRDSDDKEYNKKGSREGSSSNSTTPRN